MTVRPRRCRPRLERLEGRDTPSNLTVTFSSLSHTLTVVGDSLNNDLKFQATPGDPTKFQLSSASDTLNHLAGPFVSPSGVKNITVRLLDGDDSVTFLNTGGPIDLQGNLSINGANGANRVTSTDLKVEKAFSITNGTNTAGSDVNSLANLTVGGSLIIKNGDGDTQTSVFRNSVGLSAVVGNFSITNGTGQDLDNLLDTNVGGSVTFKNGHGNAAGHAGYITIQNGYNTSARSEIKGNVTVSDSDGNVDAYDNIFDTEVLGNVTFNHGPGSAVTEFDGGATPLPVIIRGSLTLTGTGGNQVQVGNSSQQSGLIVGKNFSVSSGGAADTVALNKLEVGGTTRLNLGDGANNVTIDDSRFAGTFTLTTGAGGDVINLDTTAGSGGPTTFERPVVITLGAGNDTLTRAGITDANQELVILDTFVIHHGTGSDVDVPPAAGHELFPLLTSIQWVS
jgi:hypothetical protein